MIMISETPPVFNMEQLNFTKNYIYFVINLSKIKYMPHRHNFIIFVLPEYCTADIINKTDNRKGRLIL